MDSERGWGDFPFAMASEMHQIVRCVPAAILVLTTIMGCGSRVPSGTAAADVAPPVDAALLTSLPVDGVNPESFASQVAALRGRVETRVNLSFSTVTDDDLARLQFPATVREIDLSGTRITDRGVESLLRADRLESLVLMDTQVTAGVVEILKRMPSLCDVRLDNTNVPLTAQLEMVRYFAPRASARAQRQSAAARREQP